MIIWGLIGMLAASIVTIKVTTDWYHLEADAWSMLPTLRPDDFLLTWRWGYRLRRGDLIVFEHGGVCLVKRLIGLPGDHVALSDHVVRVNHDRLDEPYVLGATLDFQVVTVPPDHYYVLGDARANSWDSRHFQPPCIPRAWIRGKVWRRIRPPQKQRESAILSPRP